MSILYPENSNQNLILLQGTTIDFYNLIHFKLGILYYYVSRPLYHSVNSLILQILLQTTTHTSTPPPGSW